MATQVADILKTHRRSSNKTHSDIELPEAIDSLIDNKLYRAKFRKLVRDGHLGDLLQLTEIAQTKAKPSRWFAVVTAKASWERTLLFLKELKRVQMNAIEVIRRLKAKKEQYRPIYAACWRLRDSVMHHAAVAEEVGRDKFKFFCWLTRPGAQP